MSLITRCPACGTKFRVVADQLRISDGWVRCGRCQEVFDAQAALEPAQTVLPQVPTPSADRSLDIAAVVAPSENTEAPTSSLQQLTVPITSSAPFVSSPAEIASGHEPAQSLLSEGYELPAPPELDLDFEITEQAQDSHKSTTAIGNPGDDWLDLPTKEIAPKPVLTGLAEQATQALSSSETQDFERPVAPPKPAIWEPQLALQAEERQANVWAEVMRFIHPPKPQETLPADDEQFSAKPVSPIEDVAAAGSLEAAAHSDALQSAVPSFVKQAQRKAWWNQPGVRFAMGMLLILLPIALLLQMVVHERNRLAAWKPEWRNGLDVMCAVLRCEITSYKNIASVVLTGSAFVQDALPHHYKLDLSIQNQATMSVATPAVELTLTDAQDQVLVRKVLNLADIGAPKELAARGEWNGTLPIMTQGLNLPVSGYRVMAFYP